MRKVHRSCGGDKPLARPGGLSALQLGPRLESVGAVQGIKGSQASKKPIKPNIQLRLYGVGDRPLARSGGLSALQLGRRLESVGAVQGIKGSQASKQAHPT